MNTVSPSTASKQQLLKAQSEKKRKKDDRINSALRFALFMHTGSQARWEKLIAEGAHDNQIWHALLREFGSGGSSQDDDGEQFTYLGGKGSEQPKFWFNQGTHYTQEKPTLAGVRLVNRVRELLQIPPSKTIYAKASVLTEMLEKADSRNKVEQVINGYQLENPSSVYVAPEDRELIQKAVETARARFDDSAANDDAVPSDAHEFKPTTSRDGRCSVCNKSRSTPQHRAFTAQQKQREKLGKPKRDASFWRQQAAEMSKRIARELREYDTPGKKTLRKIEEYEARIKSALEDQQWQATLINIADAIDEGNLPPVLFGLTNSYQVRQLIGPGRYDFKPSNMGPTIKTVEELRAAHEALKPLIPEMHEDPNLDPRDGTQWAQDISAAPANTDDEPGKKACTECGLLRPESDGAGCPVCKWGVDESEEPSAHTAISDEQDRHTETGDARSQTALQATPATATHKRELECELTDDDLLAKLNELTTKLTDKDSVEQELKEVSAGYKGRIKTLDRDIHTLTRTITQKRETREIDCRERFNFEGYKVEVIRLDTFEVVETRNMTARERQQTLPSI